jgi:hypothetical protein
MAVLTKIPISEAGAVATGVAANAGGDTIPNVDGKAALLIHNGSGGAITVTAVVQNPTLTTDGFGVVTKASVALVVAAGARAIIGKLPPNFYNNGNGELVITYSGVTSLFVQAISLP